MSLLLAGEPLAPGRLLRPTLRRAATLLELVLCLPGCQGRETPRADDVCPTGDCGMPIVAEKHLRIAAFNVHRLFDTVCDSAACGGANYEELPTPRPVRRAGRPARPRPSPRSTRTWCCWRRWRRRPRWTALRERPAGFAHAQLGEINTAAPWTWRSSPPGPSSSARPPRAGIYRPDGSATRFSRELLEVHLDVAARGSSSSPRTSAPR